MFINNHMVNYVAIEVTLVLVVKLGLKKFWLCIYSIVMITLVSILAASYLKKR